jgi:hypothetical protein
MRLVGEQEAIMQITRDGSQKGQPPVRGNPARKLVAWQVKGLRMWRDLSGMPKEDMLIIGMFAAVIIITVWLAARVL